MNYLTALNQIQHFVPEIGQKILEIYKNRTTLEITTKSNATPLTQADMLAHQMIMNGLAQITPDLPVISEEGKDIPFSTRKTWEYFWLVDPLDGTREFIEGTDEFTINIALIYKHQAIIGLIYQPTTQDCFYAVKDQGVWWKKSDGIQIPIHTRAYDEANLEILISRHHTPKWLTQALESSQMAYHFHGVGSSLKFCRLAAGLADVYPRMGTTSEWDTAAGQCILEQAGGLILQASGDPLLYNTKESLENPSFIAFADKNKDRALWMNWFR